MYGRPLILKLIELDKFKPKVYKYIKQFIRLIEKWRNDLKKIKHFDLLKLVLDEFGLFFNIKE